MNYSVNEKIKQNSKCNQHFVIPTAMTIISSIFTIKFLYNFLRHVSQRSGWFVLNVIYD